MSGLWCCNLGYSQKSIADAVYAQLQELPYYNNFFNCSNQPALEMDHDFCCDEAAECFEKTADDSA